MPEMLMVGMAEIKLVSHSQDALIALGLGSCVGVCAFDPVAGVAALAHIVLPINEEPTSTPGKFANTAVPLLLATMTEQGACVHRIRVALAGGAQLFSFNGNAPHLDIGSRNLEATLHALTKAGVEVVATDAGGNKGRSLHFYGDGRVRVKIIGQQEHELALLARTPSRTSLISKPPMPGTAE